MSFLCSSSSSSIRPGAAQRMRKKLCRFVSALVVNRPHQKPNPGHQPKINMMVLVSYLGFLASLLQLTASLRMNRRSVRSLSDEIENEYFGKRRQHCFHPEIQRSSRSVAYSPAPGGSPLEGCRGGGPDFEGNRAGGGAHTPTYSAGSGPMLGVHTVGIISRSVGTFNHTPPNYSRGSVSGSTLRTGAGAGISSRTSQQHQLSRASSTSQHPLSPLRVTKAPTPPQPVRAAPAPPAPKPTAKDSFESGHYSPAKGLGDFVRSGLSSPSIGGSDFQHQLHGGGLSHPGVVDGPSSTTPWTRTTSSGAPQQLYYHGNPTWASTIASLWSSQEEQQPDISQKQLQTHPRYYPEDKLQAQHQHQDPFAQRHATYIQPTPIPGNGATIWSSMLTPQSGGYEQENLSTYGESVSLPAPATGAATPGGSVSISVRQPASGSSVSIPVPPAMPSSLGARTSGVEKTGTGVPSNMIVPERTVRPPVGVGPSSPSIVREQSPFFPGTVTDSPWWRANPTAPKSGSATPIASKAFYGSPEQKSSTSRPATSTCQEQQGSTTAASSGASPSASSVGVRGGVVGALQGRSGTSEQPRLQQGTSLISSRSSNTGDEQRFDDGTESSVFSFRGGPPATAAVSVAASPGETSFRPTLGPETRAQVFQLGKEPGKGIFGGEAMTSPPASGSTRSPAGSAAAQTVTDQLPRNWNATELNKCFEEAALFVAHLEFPADTFISATNKSKPNSSAVHVVDQIYTDEQDQEASSSSFASGTGGGGSGAFTARLNPSVGPGGPRTPGATASGDHDAPGTSVDSATVVSRDSRSDQQQNVQAQRGQWSSELNNRSQTSSRSQQESIASSPASTAGSSVSVPTSARSSGGSYLFDRGHSSSRDLRREAQPLLDYEGGGNSSQGTSGNSSQERRSGGTVSTATGGGTMFSGRSGLTSSWSPSSSTRSGARASAATSASGRTRSHAYRHPVPRLPETGTPQRDGPSGTVSTAEETVGTSAGRRDQQPQGQAIQMNNSRSSATREPSTQQPSSTSTVIDPQREHPLLAHEPSFGTLPPGTVSALFVEEQQQRLTDQLARERIEADRISAEKIRKEQELRNAVRVMQEHGLVSSDWEWREGDPIEGILDGPSLSGALASSNSTRGTGGNSTGRRRTNIPSTSGTPNSSTSAADTGRTTGNSDSGKHKKTALLVIDVQKDFWTANKNIRDAFPDFPIKIGTLLGKARRGFLAQLLDLIVHVRAVYGQDHGSKWCPFFTEINEGKKKCEGVSDDPEEFALSRDEIHQLMHSTKDPTLANSVVRRRRNSDCNSNRDTGISTSSGTTGVVTTFGATVVTPKGTSSTCSTLSSSGLSLVPTVEPCSPQASSSSLGGPQVSSSSLGDPSAGSSERLLASYGTSTATLEISSDRITTPGRNYCWDNYMQENGPASPSSALRNRGRIRNPFDSLNSLYNLDEADEDAGYGEQEESPNAAVLRNQDQDGRDAQTGARTNGTSSSSKPQQRLLLQEQTEDNIIQRRVQGDVKGIPSAPAEIILHKPNFDAFLDTALDGILKRHGIEQVVIAGMVTSACVQASALGAFMRGYRVMLLEDCLADRSVERHNAILDIYRDYVYETSELADVEQRLSSGAEIGKCNREHELLLAGA